MAATTTTSDKTLGVLDLFTPKEPEWTVEAAADRLNFSVSTTYRHFRSLAASGLITSYTPGYYVLGPRILELDRQLRIDDPLIDAARPAMQRFRETPQPSVFLLCRPYREQVMCLHQEASDSATFASSYERGRPMSLFRGSMSKIILANLPIRTLRGLYERNRGVALAAGLGPDWPEVKRHLRKMRTEGYSMTFGELDQGMVGISVPLMDPKGDVAGSLGRVVREIDMDKLSVPHIVEQLREGAKMIEETMAVNWTNRTGTTLDKR